MFGGSTNPWQPSVDVPAVIASMTAEAIHKRAFYMVGESERLTKISRRKRLARFLLDLPRYGLIGVVIVVGLFMIELGADILKYLHPAPTVVATRAAVLRLWNWLFTDAGLVTALVVAVLLIGLNKVRKRLKKFVDDA
jgi:chromate transport protein ChrA